MGGLSPNRITSAYLSNLQRDLKNEGAENATVNRKTEVLTAMLNYSTKNRRVPFNPSSGFRKLPLNQIEMSFWEASEAQDFLSFASARYPETSELRWIYIVYLLALNIGMRAGEIWGLKAPDLIDDGEIILIRRQFNRVTKSFSPPKGKKPRSVPCCDSLRTELLNWIKFKRVNSDQTIFQGASQNPVNHDTFGDRRFDKDVGLWGGRRIRFHDMRHTAASLMIANGVDLKTVKEICGHKNIATTMNYCHLVKDNLKQAAKLFSLKPNLEFEPKKVVNSGLFLVK